MINAAWLRFGIAALIFSCWFGAVFFDPKDAQPATLVNCIEFALVAVGAYHAKDLATVGRLTPAMLPRIIGGVSLFLMWFALVATKHAQANDLINAALMALAGLGLFPSTQASSKEPAVSPETAATFQPVVEGDSK